MHSERTGRILAVVVAVALAGALGVMWLRSGGDDVEVATAAEAEAGGGAERDASEDGNGADSDERADSDDRADSDEPTPAPANGDDPVDSPGEDTAEESGTDTETDADGGSSANATEGPEDGMDDEVGDEPTEEPTDEVTDAPDEEPSDEPTEEQTEDADELDDEIDDDLRAELDELRTVGGPAEALVRAEDQDDIENWLHSAWAMERFQPVSDETSEWSNRDELWNDIVDAVWERAVAEYGDRLRDQPGTVWDRPPDVERGLPRPAFGVYGTAQATNEYGYLTWVWVGVDPADPDQQRPDAGVYYAQVIPREEAPGLWHGELHRVASMCVVSGELIWDEDWGGQVWDAIGGCGSEEIANEPWETIVEIQEGNES